MFNNIKYLQIIISTNDLEVLIGYAYNLIDNDAISGLLHIM